MQNYCRKRSSLQPHSEDDIRRLADLKQQISQKIILLMQHIAIATVSRISAGT